jgi:hypothetical protein
VLLRRRAGAGAFILSTYPLEYMAAVTPAVNPEPTHRLYAALAREVGIVPDVRVDDPRVMVSELVRDDGVRLVWFVSQSETAIAVKPALTAGSLFDGERAADTVELPPFGVAVLELRN